MTLLKGQRPRKPLEFDLLTYEVALRWIAAYLSGMHLRDVLVWRWEASAVPGSRVQGFASAMDN